MNDTMNFKLYLNGAITKPQNSDVFDQCKKINEENSTANGGTLIARTHIEKANYLLVVIKPMMVEEKRKSVVVGYLCLRHYDDGLYISQLAVSKDHQRQGIADRMIEYVEDHLVIEENLYLHVNHGNDNAHALFQKHNFVPMNVKYKKVYK